MINVAIQSYQLAWSVDSYSPIEEYRSRFGENPAIGCHIIMANNKLIFSLFLQTKYYTHSSILNPIMIIISMTLYSKAALPKDQALPWSSWLLVPIRWQFLPTMIQNHEPDRDNRSETETGTQWSYWWCPSGYSNKIHDCCPGEGDWTNVIISGDLADPGFTHMRTYLISNLLPDSE